MAQPLFSDLSESFFIESHITGVGAFLNIPSNVEYKITRQLPREKEYLVSQGNLMWQKRYLDTDVAIVGETVYRFYIQSGIDAENKPIYALNQTEIHVSKPNLFWSPMMDGSAFTASEPRDALILFLSIRLAQLVQQGHIKLPQDKKAHGLRFPVRGTFEFVESDMPVVAIDYGGGQGSAGDLGWAVSEDNLKLNIYIAADRLEDRNAVGKNIIALMREIDWFLSDYGCLNIEYGEYQHYLEARLNIPVYMAQMSIGFTRFLFQFQEQQDEWQILGSPIPITIESINGVDCYIIDNADGAI